MITTTFNNVQPTNQSYLAYQTKQHVQQSRDVARQQVILSTLANAASIQQTIGTQLAQLNVQRYEPYQPYVYPVVPLSVQQLQMATANVGNPMPPITVMDCKANFSVTK